MAQRRMVSLKIVDSDAFLDMPQTSQLLYYHLTMRADDDGFVAAPKKIMRMVGSHDDDYKVLLAKRFILPFESGVCVIKHWLVHNIIRSDRYTETTYKLEKSGLEINEFGAYTEKKNTLGNQSATSRQPVGTQTATQVRLGKVRLGKIKDNRGHFVPPSQTEVMDYCNERQNGVDPEQFIDFYTSKGWMIGKNKMKDWRAAVRTWEKKEIKEKSKNNSGVRLLHDNSRAIFYNGRWVDADNKTVVIDLSYYPELTK